MLSEKKGTSDAVEAGLPQASAENWDKYRLGIH